MAEMKTRTRCNKRNSNKCKNKEKACDSIKTWTHPNGKIERQIGYVFIGKTKKLGKQSLKDSQQI